VAFCVLQTLQVWGLTVWHSKCQGKKVVNGSCRECGEDVGQTTTRYVLSVTLSDLSGTTWATAFDETAKVSCFLCTFYLGLLTTER
jgi:hypothetical protein